MIIPTEHKRSRMKKEQLIILAAELNCEIDPNSKRPEILAAVNAKLGAGAIPAPTSAPVQREPGNAKLFDELTSPGEIQEGQGPDNHGGAREGAGRKPGKSMEMVKIDNLSIEPNRTVEYAIKWIFKLWAGAVGCKEIALDNDELKEFSIDTTQFLEYHGIKLPQGMHIDGKFILGGFELIGGRVMLQKAYKARLKKQEEQSNNDQG